VETVTRVRFPVFASEATAVVAEPDALAEAQWVVPDELDAIERCAA